MMGMHLEFCKRETSAGSNTTIIFDGWATHYRPELVDRAGCNGGGFLDAGIATSGLAARLLCRGQQLVTKLNITTAMQWVVAG